MNNRIGALVGLSAVALLAAGSLSFAAEESKPPMHMHKSQMDHRKQDSEVAPEYQSEATQLREKAEHHRKLAAVYKTRTPPKGSGNYTSVAQHCEKLAKYYEDAAKEADAVSSELSKQ
jgi:outer membrane biogenesis lipoprotein LolB